MKKTLVCLVLAALVLCFGCAKQAPPDGTPEVIRGGINPQKFVNENTTYTTGPLPLGWRRLWGYDADLAFFNKIHQTTIVINSTCGQKNYIPLVALKNHALFDLTERQIITQEKLEIDHRQGLRTVVQGRLDGGLIKLDIFIVQIDKCIYDMAYISNLKDYETCKEDFEKFVAGFFAKRK